MNHEKVFHINILLVLLAFGASISYNNINKGKASNSVTRACISTNDTSGCEPSLWQHVYDPSRLDVVNKCMTATGVIIQSKAEDDGDQHMLLKLDAGQENLLKKKNYKEKKGCLVIEAVCINNI